MKRFIVSCPDWSGEYKTREQTERAIARFVCPHEHMIVEVGAPDDTGATE